MWRHKHSCLLSGRSRSQSAASAVRDPPGLRGSALSAAGTRSTATTATAARCVRLERGAAAHHRSADAAAHPAAHPDVAAVVQGRPARGRSQRLLNDALRAGESPTLCLLSSFWSLGP